MNESAPQGPPGGPGDPDAAPELQVHVAADLDYLYRDMVSIYVGGSEVLLEFGNAHRALPGQVTIGNRIVLGLATAYDLQQRLQQTLQDAQRKLQAQMRRG